MSLLAGRQRGKRVWRPYLPEALLGADQASQRMYLLVGSQTGHEKCDQRGIKTNMFNHCEHKKPHVVTSTRLNKQTCDLTTSVVS